MNTTTWTTTPADLGLGGCAARLRTVTGASPASRVAPVDGTGAPAGTVAARPRSVFLQAPEQFGARTTAIAHNSIGTTLGIHSSGRPLS